MVRKPGKARHTADKTGDRLQPAAVCPGRWGKSELGELSSGGGGSGGKGVPEEILTIMDPWNHSSHTSYKMKLKPQQNVRGQAEARLMLPLLIGPQKSPFTCGQTSHSIWRLMANGVYAFLYVIFICLSTRPHYLDVAPASYLLFLFPTWWWLWTKYTWVSAWSWYYCPVVCALHWVFGFSPAPHLYHSWPFLPQ